MRTELQTRLDELEELLVRMADHADEMLGAALVALRQADPAAAGEVVRRDGAVDALYAEVQHQILETIARHAPVASDLRLLTAMIHVDLHLERMADYATSIARLVQRAGNVVPDPELAAELDEMGGHARAVGREAIRAFTQRDVEGARALPALDDRVDQLNRGVFARLVALAAVEPERVEWTERMLIVPRMMERYGDHAVDIGEQTIFAVTGQLVELSSNEPRGSDPGTEHQ